MLRKFQCTFSLSMFVLTQMWCPCFFTICLFQFCSDVAVYLSTSIAPFLLSGAYGTAGLYHILTEPVLDLCLSLIMTKSCIQILSYGR
ncbi:hypothetical protein IW262DRAFT_1421034 [Armillaria fumosa]|nr:hypothetical protein IW262DRAFT_1421034 [Armillaria fumosa]